MQQKSSISPVSTISTNPPSSPSSNTSREALFSVLAGLFPLIAAAGVPSLEKSNPGRPRLVQGATFPLGLVIVYVVGAELFTGYPMWLVMTALRRKGKMMQYVKGLLVSWVGNLLGVLISAFCFSCLTNSLHEEPYRSGLNGRVTSDVVEAAWHVIFLKAIGCGFLVHSSSFMHLSVSALGQPSIRKEVVLSRSPHQQPCRGCITNSLAAGHVSNVPRHTEPGRHLQNPRAAPSLLHLHHRQIPLSGRVHVPGLYWHDAFQPCHGLLFSWYVWNIIWPEKRGNPATVHYLSVVSRLIPTSAVQG